MNNCLFIPRVDRIRGDLCSVKYMPNLKQAKIHTFIGNINIHAYTRVQSNIICKIIQYKEAPRCDSIVGAWWELNVK